MKECRVIKGTLTSVLTFYFLLMNRISGYVFMCVLMPVSVWQLTEWTHLCLCKCESYLWDELIAFGLPQAELRQSDLHRVDDGEAAVPTLMWHHHGETALWTLRHDVTSCTQTNTAPIN